MTAWITKASTPFLVAAALFLVGALCAYLAISKVADMIGEAARTATESRDAHWTADIEKANAFAARKQPDQALHALKIETEANERVRALEAKNAELEKQNAALPGADVGGLDRDRVRLLAQ